MGRASREVGREAFPSGILLPNPKAALRSFYGGSRLESPVGGYLEILGVHALENGSARLILECTSSSLRFDLSIAGATRTEKTKVKQSLAEGLDPHCPRHGAGQRLFRERLLLVCPLCAVPFGKAE